MDGSPCQEQECTYMREPTEYIVMAVRRQVNVCMQVFHTRNVWVPLHCGGAPNRGAVPQAGAGGLANESHSQRGVVFCRSAIVTFRDLNYGAIHAMLLPSSGENPQAYPRGLWPRGLRVRLRLENRRALRSRRNNSVYRMLAYGVI